MKNSKPSDHRPRFFYVHLQKTAGTSLTMCLRNQFGRAGVYPNPPSDGTDIVELVLSIEHLQERLRVRGDEIQVIAGHFPLCTAELLGGNFTTLTMLREPVERTLSFLRHHRERTPEHRDMPLEEVYSDPFRFHGLANNHMVKMFSLSTDEMTAGMLTHVEFTPARLERAKERLATVDVVGLQESFGDFCDELTRRFGWDLGNLHHVNRTQPADVSDDFRQRIATDNAMDVELYEFAVELCKQRKAASHAASH